MSPAAEVIALLDINYFLGLRSYIDFLRETCLPIFIYGMGDGCLKLLSVFSSYNIPCAGIFASDEFVRDKSFEGHRIHSLGEIESSVDEFIVVLAFGAGYRSLIEKIDGIASRHTLFVPDMPVVGEGLFTKEYFAENFESISRVYSLLADEQSKSCYTNLLEYRITGGIRFLKSCESRPGDAMKLLKLSGDEIYCDLGAYTGDTIDEFLNATGGSYRRIYAVEPDPRNFRKLCENTCGLAGFTPINAAIGENDGVITVLKGGGRMIRKSDKGRQVALRSLDSILGGESCTYIKMDVEGSETEAIRGGARTISACQPKLNIALYHRVGDIFELPLLVHSLLPEHKLYIRHFPYYPAWDTNLYAVPD